MTRREENVLICARLAAAEKVGSRRERYREGRGYREGGSESEEGKERGRAEMGCIYVRI